MNNSWPTTVEELVDECEKLKSRYDLYTLGEKGEPFQGESEPRVDGTRYLAGEYRYGVAMIPAQWVTHVLSTPAEPDESTMLKLHGRMNAVLLDMQEELLAYHPQDLENASSKELIDCVIRAHQIVEDAATAGAETCIMDGQYGNYRCSNCGQSWQLGCVRPKEQSWTYCPHCGARIIEEETE